MSLVVISGANKVAQGIIRTLQASGKYERIIVADVFPNYYYVERYLNFKDTLTPNNTKLSEVKLTDMTDLETVLKQATDVVYVTHDYYQNVPSKLNLLKHTAQLSTKVGVKKLLAVTPVENDHYGEQNAAHAANQSENEARLAYPNIVELKTDLTFGPDSNVVTQIISRLVNSSSIYFKPSGAKLQPVHTLNVAQAAQKILGTASLQNQRYIARGNESIDWYTLVSTLANATGTSAKLNASAFENIVSPLSDNLISQTFLCPRYLNLTRFINQYQSPKGENHHDLSSLGITELATFADTYKAGSVQTAAYKCKGGASCIAYSL